jgi:hypothetical protein
MKNKSETITLAIFASLLIGVVIAAVATTARQIERNHAVISRTAAR